MITQIVEKNTKETLTGLEIKTKAVQLQDLTDKQMSVKKTNQESGIKEGGKDLIPKINSLIIMSLLEMHPGVS